MNFNSREEIGLVPPRSPASSISPNNTAGHWNGPSIWIARWGGIMDHSVCFSLWRGIQSYHMQTNGWSDIAYGAGACPHGYVLGGRGPGKRTAANGTNHANTIASAVCAVVGEGDPVTPELITAMLDAQVWLSGEGSERSGHRDWFATACPGDEIYHAYVNADVPGTASAPEPAPTPQPEPGSAVIHPGEPAPPFPLPGGWYFGPEGGPKESVSGYHSHRDDLYTWQARMAWRGWRITYDGFYGYRGDVDPAQSETGRVAIAFQQEKGLTVDGLIGPETWNAAWELPVTA